MRPLDRRRARLEAALDRASVPPDLEGSNLGVSVGAALAYPPGTVRGTLFTAAEDAMRERKRERRRSQGRPENGR